MARTWVPKYLHRCSSCGWEGKRHYSKACPRCGHWKPERVEAEG